MAQQQSSHSAENSPSWAFLQLVLPKKKERKIDFKTFAKGKKTIKQEFCSLMDIYFLILLKH